MDLPKIDLKINFWVGDTPFLEKNQWFPSTKTVPPAKKNATVKPPESSDSPSRKSTWKKKQLEGTCSHKSQVLQLLLPCCCLPKAKELTNKKHLKLSKETIKTPCHCQIQKSICLTHFWNLQLMITCRFGSCRLHVLWFCWVLRMHLKRTWAKACSITSILYGKIIMNLTISSNCFGFETFKKILVLIPKHLY